MAPWPPLVEATHHLAQLESVAEIPPSGWQGRGRAPTDGTKQRRSLAR